MELEEIEKIVLSDILEDAEKEMNEDCIATKQFLKRLIADLRNENK